MSKRAFFFDLSPWDDEPATDAPNQPAAADVQVLRSLLTKLVGRQQHKEMIHVGGCKIYFFKKQLCFVNLLLVIVLFKLVVPWAFKYTTQ